MYAWTYCLNCKARSLKHWHHLCGDCARCIVVTATITSVIAAIVHMVLGY